MSVIQYQSMQYNTKSIDSEYIWFARKTSCILRTCTTLWHSEQKTAGCYLGCCQGWCSELLEISSTSCGAYGNHEVNISWQNNHTSLSMAILLHGIPASLGHHKTAAMFVEVIRNTVYEQCKTSCVRNWTYLAKILAPVFNYL